MHPCQIPNYPGQREGGRFAAVEMDRALAGKRAAKQRRASGVGRLVGRTLVEREKILWQVASVPRKSASASMFLKTPQPSSEPAMKGKVEACQEAFGRGTVIFQPAIFMGALLASGRECYRDDRKRLCLNDLDGFMEHRGFGQHPRDFQGLLIGTPTQFYSNATLIGIP